MVFLWVEQEWSDLLCFVGINSEFEMPQVFPNVRETVKLMKGGDLVQISLHARIDSYTGLQVEFVRLFDEDHTITGLLEVSIVTIASSSREVYRH